MSSEQWAMMNERPRAAQDSLLIAHCSLLKNAPGLGRGLNTALLYSFL